MKVRYVLLQMQLENWSITKLLNHGEIQRGCKLCFKITGYWTGDLCTCTYNKSNTKKHTFCFFTWVSVVQGLVAHYGGSFVICWKITLLKLLTLALFWSCNLYALKDSMVSFIPANLNYLNEVTLIEHTPHFSNLQIL